MAKVVATFLLLFLFLFLVASETVRFDGYSVLRLSLQSQKDVDFVSLFEDEIDVWTDSLHLGLNDIMVHSERAHLFNHLLNRTLIKDVQQLIDFQLKETKWVESDPWFDSYHSYAEMMTRLEYYNNNYQSLTTLEPIGYSHENRVILALSISASPGPDRPAAFISAGLHAREWIGPMVAFFIIDQLLTGYDDPNHPQHDRIKELVDAVDIHFVPMSNPDGYEYSRLSNRMWRKNRAINQGSSYRGVDLNRNWDCHWGEGGSSSNPSSDTYKGPYAASEPEVQAIAAFFTKIAQQHKLAVAMDYHSYSQLMLRSWGWSRTDTPDEAENRNVGAEMVSRIRNKYGKSYTNQKIVDLYLASGGASDYYYEEGAKYHRPMLAFTTELRDTGQYGFLLPPSQIVETGEENLEAILFLIEQALPDKK